MACVNTVGSTQGGAAKPARPAPPGHSTACASTVGSTQPRPAKPARPAQPVHRLQGIRFPGRDYRIPAFYLITMTALGRRPLFGSCANNAVALSPDGQLVEALWRRIAIDYPAIDLCVLRIMPDHLHGVLRVTRPLEKPLGVPLRAFKSQVTSALRKRSGNPALEIWMPGYHDWAVWRSGSLAAYKRYVLDNPRRYCLRKAHPDLFTSIRDLQHSRLPLEERWCGYGNLFLLDKPELHALRVSRSIPSDQLDALRREALDEVHSGGVLVSPFISPGEKEIARAALDAGGSVILIKPDGFDPCFKPKGRYFDLCAEGRLLILACRPPEPRAVPLTRELCLAMNRWCAAIAGAKPLPV